MKKFFLSFWKEELGQDMVEYALVVGIIALGATLTMGTVAGHIVDMWEKVDGAITGATAKIT